MVSLKCYGAIKLILLLIVFFLAPNEHGNLNFRVAKCANTNPEESDSDGTTQAEPPFPLLFDPGDSRGPISPRRAKIVSELIGKEGGKATAEEYLDLEAGQYAYEVSTTTNNLPSPMSKRQVILSDSTLNQTFIYTPYSCEVVPMLIKKFSSIDNWSVIYTFDGKNLRAYGAAAMWIHAGFMPRKYESLGSVAYSNRKDALVVRHRWTYQTKFNDLEFKLTFVEIITLGDKGKAEIDGARMSLETVQALSLKTGAVLRTFNVISLEYDLDAEVYDTLLQVPVGYGCQVDQDRLKRQDQLDKFKRETKFFSSKLWSSSRVELEVSGTQIDPMSGSRPSDTIYVELAHAFDKIHGQKRKLSLVKFKSDSREVKTILNYALNVRYTIDMQKSTCLMGHLPNEYNRPADEPYTYEGDYNSDTRLIFSNGLEFPFEPEQIDYLFYNSDNYIVVRETEVWLSPTEKVTYTYVERTIDSWPYGIKNNNKFARQVRTFVTREPSEKSKKSWRPGHTRLESFTIWVFGGRPGQSSTIESVYQINVVKHETGLSRWPDVPRLFDVSQECYLQNEDMHSGQDYAWVEFFYPLSSHELDIFMQHETRLDRELHNQLTVEAELLTSFQVPRIELMFSDEGLFVRALLLDVPSLHLTYKSIKRELIDIDKERGDLMFITPDTQHCSKICRQYSCKSMTFCMKARSCLLGMRPVYASSDETTVGTTASERLQITRGNKDCVTYSANGAQVGPESLPSLSSVLSMMKNYNYKTEGMPRLPDDLPYRDDADAVIADYHTKFSEYFAKEGLPMLTVSGFYNNLPLTLVPGSCSIEDDPFEKFGVSIIGAAQNEDDDEILHDSGRIADYFHEGLSMSRYKYNAFHNGHRDKARLLFGITYDQCALGCLDSKCGTFSYCLYRKECILTTFNQITEASREKLVENDANCFISQRDFTKNYQKYPNVKRPLRALADRKAASVSDCALACMQYDGFRACVSFDYCSKTTQASNCYLQPKRHPSHIFHDDSTDAAAAAVIGDDKPEDSEAELCDHYERSYLAEFNQIESTQFSEDLWASFNQRTIYTGRTTFECADICLNKLDDCSAFQFCLLYSDTNDNHMQQCHMIRDKSLLANGASGQDKLELVIDPSEHDSESLIKANKFLKYSDNCQVYALRPNTVEGHLRDLALGNTMTISQKEEFERQTKEPAPFSGYQMSWARYLLVVVGTVIAASLITVGALWAYQRNEVVRYQVERLKLGVCLF